MFFKDIIGHDELKRRLINTVKSGHIAHAQLFEGSDGAGTLPLAIAYARYLQCTGRSDNDACGTCPSCRQISALMHPDPALRLSHRQQETAQRARMRRLYSRVARLPESHPLPLGRKLAAVPGHRQQPAAHLCTRGTRNHTQTDAEKF